MSEQNQSIYDKWKNRDLVTIEWCIDRGIVRSAIVTYCELYDEFKRQREAGLNYIQAVESTADKMNTTPGTVKRAVAEMMC